MMLKGLKGFSAWSVYNKVAFNFIFLRKYTKKSRDFNVKISALFDLDDAETIKKHLVELLDDGVNFNTEVAQCVSDFKACEDHERKLMLVEALNYSDLTDDEVMRLLVLHTDSNGINYTKANIDNIEISRLLPMMIDSLIACSHIDCDLSIIGKDQIESLKGKRLDVRSEAGDILASNSEIQTDELLALSIKKAFNNKGS